MSLRNRLGGYGHLANLPRCIIWQENCGVLPIWWTSIEDQQSSLPRRRYSIGGIYQRGQMALWDFVRTEFMLMTFPRSLLTTLPESSVVYSCPGCNRELPIRPARSGDVLFMWACEQCNARFTGALNDGISEELEERIRLVSFRVNPQFIPKQTLSVGKIEAWPDDRRAADRSTLHITVPAIGLTERFHPLGPLMSMLSRDISATGIGLAYSEPITAPFLAIQLSVSPQSEPIQMAVKVMHCSAVASGSWAIGGSFVQRFGK